MARVTPSLVLIWAWVAWVLWPDRPAAGCCWRWSFCWWTWDHSGPMDRSSSRATTRSPSFRPDSAPMMAISGSEPGSSRSSSRKVRSGAYSGPEARRVMPQALSPSANRRGSSSWAKVVMRAWG